MQKKKEREREKENIKNGIHINIFFRVAKSIKKKYVQNGTEQKKKRIKHCGKRYIKYWNSFFCVFHS